MCNRPHICSADLMIERRNSRQGCCEAARSALAGERMTVGEEQRIRERAYSIWEQEGRPHGRDLDHRLRAEAKIAAERGRGGDGTAHHPDIRGDDRERLTKAAEALFTPKQPAQGGKATAGKSVRKS